MPGKRVVVAAFFGLGLAAPQSSSIAGEKPRMDAVPVLFGAIRWDAYHGGDGQIYTDSMRTMSPEKWRYRLPFYAQVNKDGTIEANAAKQEIMDQEIAYAKAARLDYWAFLFYVRYGDDYEMNRCLRLYLQSKHKSDVGFCLILCHLPDKEKWPACADRLVAYFKEATYQKVLKGRPLVYFFRQELKDRFGSWPAAKGAIELLRSKTKAAGLSDPYLVIQHYSTTEQEQAVQAAGFNAVSEYTAHHDTGRFEEKPYSHLAAVNQEAWNRWLGLGVEVVPVVNAGWDLRPIQEINTHWYQPSKTVTYWTEPTPDEFAANCQSAADWCKRHPKTTPARTVMIYAWNEWMEGGYIVPTARDGAARLNALQKVSR